MPTAPRPNRVINLAATRVWPPARTGDRALAAEVRSGRAQRRNKAIRPATDNLLRKNARSDDYLGRCNHERPHQALDMQVPAQVYAPSSRPYRGLEDLDYPAHDFTATVTACGRICFNRRKINLSVVFAGRNVGVKQVADQLWLVSFMHYDLGCFDSETCRLEPLNNPFSPKVLPMSPV